MTTERVRRYRVHGALGALVLLATGAACNGPGLSNVPMPWDRPDPPQYDPETQPVMEARRARNADDQVIRKWYVQLFPNNFAVLHGSDVSWYGDGTLKSVQHWNRGVRDGRFARWYADGGLELDRTYDDGEGVGVWRSWAPDGTQRTEVPMSGVGVARFWHSNGNLSAEGPQRDGVRHGEWTIWWESGGVREAGEYEDGRRIGVWRRWRLDGTERESETIREGGS